MARLQVLWLPGGDDGEQPFALVLDRVTTEEAEAMAAPLGRAQLENFSKCVGSKGLAVFDCEVDVE